MTDGEIIGLFFARLEQAIVELDRKYGALCHGLAGNILGNALDAEECVNDAYLGIWNCVPPRKPEKLSAFVCRIVRNIAINRYYANMAAKRNSAYDVTMSEIGNCLPASYSVEDEIITKELARMIEGFLETLTAENRMIFMRRYWFADTCRQIAGRTGLSEKNISVRLTRIRKQMRDYLIEREMLA